MNKFNNGYSPVNYVGNIASMASAGAAFGLPGALIGGGIGLAMSIRQKRDNDRASDRAREMDRISAGMSRGSLMDSVIKSQYSMDNQTNFGIPGFNKGIANFKPNSTTEVNSFVSSGEVIRDSMSGRLLKVPGKYNKKKIDTVPANLSEGDSVYSADPMQALPFGNSTPAKIASKVMNLQKTAESGGRIDKATAELGAKQLEKLDMYTWLMNKGGSGMYSTGKSPYTGVSIVEYLRSIGKDPSMTNRRKLAQEYGIDNYSGSPDQNLRLLRMMMAEPTIAPGGGKINNEGFNNPIPSINVETEYLPGSDLSSEGFMPDPIAIDPSRNVIAENIDFDQFNLTKEERRATNRNKFKFAARDFGSKAGNFLGGIDYRSGLNALAAVSPALMNMFGKTEVANPVYDSFVSPRTSYSVSTPLSSIREQSRVARYNQSLSGGSGMPYGSAIHGQSLSSMENVFNAANTFNAESHNRFAGAANEALSRNAAETRRVQDINMRSRAAKRTATNTAVSQLGEFAQQKQLERNMMERDQQGLAMWSMSNGTNFTEDQINSINSLWGQGQSKRKRR